MTDPRTTFTELVGRTDRIPDNDLDAFWSTLEWATVDIMIGEWIGWRVRQRELRL